LTKTQLSLYAFQRQTYNKRSGSLASHSLTHSGNIQIQQNFTLTNTAATEALLTYTADDFGAYSGVRCSNLGRNIDYH
jgi:hypothetical protein